MKKNFIRISFFALAVLLAISAAACNRSEPQESETATVEVKTAPVAAVQPDKKTYKVGFSNVWVGNSWGVQCVNELESYLKNSDRVSDYFITDANNDTNKQISDIQDLLSKDIDLLLLQPISPDAVAPIIEEAYDKGVVVVTCASPVGTDKYHASVLAKDEDFGRTGMEWLAKELNGKGNIIILNGMAGLTVAVNRRAGVQEVLDQYPDIKVLGEEYADWDYAKGKVATENLLSAFPEIDGVWSCGGDMTRGAIEAFQAAGRSLVPMTGEDNNGFLKLWKLNEGNGFTSIATSMPTWLFAAGAEVGLNILDGVGEKEDIIVDIPVITKETLDQFVREDLSDSFWANTRMPEKDIEALYGNGNDGTQGLKK